MKTKKKIKQAKEIRGWKWWWGAIFICCHLKGSYFWAENWMRQQRKPWNCLEKSNPGREQQVPRSWMGSWLEAQEEQEPWPWWTRCSPDIQELIAMFSCWDFVLRVVEVTGVFQREITRCIDHIQSKLQLQSVLFDRKGTRWNETLVLEFWLNLIMII